MNLCLYVFIWRTHAGPLDVCVFIQCCVCMCCTFDLIETCMFVFLAHLRFNNQSLPPANNLQMHKNIAFKKFLILLCVHMRSKPLTFPCWDTFVLVRTLKTRHFSHVLCHFSNICWNVNKCWFWILFRCKKQRWWLCSCLARGLPTLLQYLDLLYRNTVCNYSNSNYYIWNMTWH